MDKTILCYNCFGEKNGDGACRQCGYVNGKSTENPILLPEGTMLNGQYLIGAAVGHGGFGITYAALDMHLERKVAVKEYFPNGISTRTSETPTVFSLTTQAAEQNYEYGKAKFIEEAKTLARFSRLDSIVYVYGYFEANNTAYIVMEYLEGEDLMQYTKKQGGKLSWEDAIRLVAPVFDALEAVHDAGLIHRDISPDNIFITNQGKTKLLDFGTARFAIGEKSKSLSVILKPGYAPPEQYYSRGKQGPWTDIYSLAATLYKLITGETPPEALERQMSGGAQLELAMYAGIPESFKKGILKALSLEPAYRQQSIRQLRENLFVTDESAPPRQEKASQKQAETVFEKRKQEEKPREPDQKGNKQEAPAPNKEERRKAITGVILVAIVAAALIFIVITVVNEQLETVRKEQSASLEAEQTKPAAFASASEKSEPETTTPVYSVVEEKYEEADEYDETSYILPYSASEYISASDISRLDYEQTYLARCEIFARHQCVFDIRWVQEYFNGCSWYSGYVLYGSFNENELNSCEYHNLQVIMESLADITGYIVYDSNSRYLVVNDLLGLSDEQACLARNEIFARNGRMFEVDWIRAYFNSCSWYNGYIDPNEFNSIVLNDYELCNVDTIQEYEKRFD